MFTRSLLWPSPISSPSIRKKWEAMASAKNENKKANLFAKRKEKIKLPKFTDEQGKDFHISEFLAHPSGMETLLNKRALQSLEPIDSNTFRCTLHKIKLLNNEVVPVIDLRVTPTSEDCTVEMLSCTSLGSISGEQQNEVFSAFMVNHITWEDDDLEPCLQVDVTMKITMEIYSKPFNFLPVSVVEAPGNLVMQGLIDRLVPLLGDQILRDYHAWIKEQSQLATESQILE